MEWDEKGSIIIKVYNTKHELNPENEKKTPAIIILDPAECTIRVVVDRRRMRMEKDASTCPADSVQEGCAQMRGKFLFSCDQNALMNDLLVLPLIIIACC